VGRQTCKEDEVPLDVDVTREHVRLSASAAAALRHGIQALEDHLSMHGIDDATLHVRLTSADDGAIDVRATLEASGLMLVRNVQDQDAAYGLTRMFSELRDEASFAELEPTMVPGEGTPWADVSARLRALAHHEVHRAEDLGDLPAGLVEADDLADEILTARLENGADEDPGALMPRLRASLRRKIEDQIARAARADGDVSLDAPADPVAAAADGTPVEEDPYAFHMPDETRLKNEDLIG
jgi:hypothetical protein